jgi:hypothetical protein
MTKETEHEIIRAILIALIPLPLGGYLCAWTAYLIGYWSAEGEWDFYEASAWAPVGFISAFVLGGLAVWPLRNASLFMMIRYLVGGPFVLALPVALIPGVGLAFSWWAGIFGFGIGAEALSLRISKDKGVEP